MIHHPARPSLLLPVLMILAVALLLAGCGGDQDSGAASATDEPRAATEAPESAASEEGGDDAAEEDAVRQAYADGMTEGGELMETVGDRFESAGDFEAFAVATKSLNGAISHFNGLTPPAEVATEHGEMVAAMKDVRAAARKITATSTEASDDEQLAIIDAEFTQMNEALDKIFAGLEDA